MATKIVTKNSSTASAVPTASDLVQGELAVNVADKRLFTEDNGGSIVELGTNPSTIDINAGTIDGTTIGASSASTGAFTTLTASGEITANSGIALGDNDKAKFGAGNDLQIYHDGSNSYISDQGTNDLKILATDFQLKNAADNEFMMTAVTDGAVTLYHNSAAKLATTSTGIDVTGTVTASPSGGVATLGANGHITSKQSLDVATAGGRYIGSSNRGILGQLRIEQATTGADGGYIDFDTCANGSTSPTNRMRIDSSGHTSFTLGTDAVGTFSDAIGEVGSGNFALQVTNSAGSSLKPLGFRAEDIRFATGSTERMRIDSSGNVGIGITSSLEKFTVANASSGIVGRFTNNTNQTLDLGVISGSGAAGGVYYNSANSGYHAFQVGGTEKMRLDSSGNVGIGTSSPVARLEVHGAFPYSGTVTSLSTSVTKASARIRGSSDASTSLYFGSLGNDAEQYIQASNDSGTGADDIALNPYGGNVVVGKTTTALGTAGHTFGNDGYLYHTRSGDIMFLNRLGSDGTIVTFLKDGSTVGTISTNSSSLPSDRNFKRNIKDLTLGLDFVESLNPVTYNYKIDDEGQAVMAGLIAQEVEESLTAAGVEKNSMTLLQHSPTEDVNESDYQMDYLKFVPILINSIKEQQTLIESLTARIAALEE